MSGFSAVICFGIESVKRGPTRHRQSNGIGKIEGEKIIEKIFQFGICFLITVKV